MSILNAIGNTPLLKIEDGIYAKAEYLNPSGSLKARMAMYLIKRAEREGLLKPGMTIVEATSGSTGNALALLAAVKGYKLKILIPEGYSNERTMISKGLGAQVEHVDHFFVNQAHEMALEMGKQDGYYCPAQFDNDWNPEGHATFLGPEIDQQARDIVKFDAVVQGAGTGGTIIGVTKALRKLHNPELKCFVLEPAESRTIETGQVAEHKIQGIADGWEPSIITRNKDMIDGFIPVPSDDAIKTCHELAHKGLFVGPSSGANIAAARDILKSNPDVKNVVTFLCDKGEKYLSDDGFVAN